jgi:hypothetical protein
MTKMGVQKRQAMTPTSKGALTGKQISQISAWRQCFPNFLLKQALARSASISYRPARLDKYGKKG